jgi:hypothetical protein
MSAELRFLPPSKPPGSAEAEGSDRINVLNAQEVFLEDAGNIHLQCQQNHRPFLTSRIAFFSFIWNVIKTTGLC